VDWGARKKIWKNEIKIAGISGRRNRFGNAWGGREDANLERRLTQPTKNELRKKISENPNQKKLFEEERTARELLR